jgi:hypothetical protein
MTSTAAEKRKEKKRMDETDNTITGRSGIGSNGW